MNDKKSGMKKSRLVALLKAGKDGLWEERQQGTCSRHLPIVPKTGNKQGTREQVKGSRGCSSLFPLLIGGNRKDPCFETRSSCSGTSPTKIKQQDSGLLSGVRQLRSLPQCGRRDDVPDMPGIMNADRLPRVGLSRPPNVHEVFPGAAERVWKWSGPEPTHYEHEGIHDTTQDGSKCVIHPH